MPQEPLNDPELLAGAARRAARWPHLFAYVLSRYSALNALNDDELCALLECDMNTLNRLRLCARPDPGHGSFSTDVQRIADKLGLDPGTVARIVREVDVAGTFEIASSQTSPPFSSTHGMLKAARDHKFEAQPGVLREESNDYQVPEESRQEEPQETPDEEA